MHTLRLFGFLIGSAIALSTSLNSQVVNAQILLQHQGILERGDNVLRSDGSLYDEYTFSGQAGQQVRITLKSPEFDTLMLLDPNGSVVEQNDDVNTNSTDSEITVILPNTGIYRVIANSYDRSNLGAYVVTVQTSEQSTDLFARGEELQSLPDGDHRYYNGALIGNFSRIGTVYESLVFRKNGNVVIGIYFYDLDENPCFIGTLNQNRIVDITYGFPQGFRQPLSFKSGSDINLEAFNGRDRQLDENGLRVLNDCIQEMQRR